MAPTLTRRLIRAGGWAAVKRGIKAIPVAGSVFAVGLAGYEIRKKGLLPGVAHVGLDLIPFVGTAKNVIEIFTGDFIPDKGKQQLAADERGETRIEQYKTPQMNTDNTELT
jgi:hypothetical protein